MLNVTYDCGKLNIIPHTFIPPVVHCSYGDTGVTINFEIYKGKQLFVIPDGTKAQVYGVRADGANWGPVDATVNKASISFVLDEVITGFEGSSIAEVVFSQEDGDQIYTLGTANFAIMIEPAAWHLRTAYADDISTYREILKYVQKSISSAKSIISKANSILDNAIDAAKAEVDKNLQTYFQDWINGHVGTGSDVTDKTLTLENASADAKATGDRINNLDNNLSPRLAIAEAKIGYNAASIDNMEDCCEDVRNDIRILNNFVAIAKRLHDPVYLLDTEGNNLLTTDGKPILVTL